MRSFTEYLDRKRREFGAKFDPSGLDRRFVPYFESGERISVRLPWGEVIRGYVGVTTGWKPVFLLIRKSRSRGSSDLLGPREQIVPHVPKRRPKKPRMLFNMRRSRKSADWKMGSCQACGKYRRTGRHGAYWICVPCAEAMKLHVPFREKRLKANPACVVCHGDLVLLGHLGNLRWFRCQACGMEQSKKVRTRRKAVKRNPIESTGGGGFVVTGKAVDLYRLLALKGAMKLELTTGMKMSRGISPFRIVKQEYGFKGSKQKLYDQLCAYIERVGPGLAKNPGGIYGGVRYWKVCRWNDVLGRMEHIAKVRATYAQIKRHFPGAVLRRIDKLVGEVVVTKRSQVRIPARVRK